MKKVGIIVLLLLFSVSAAYSQLFKGEILAGANLTQVDGDEVAGYKKFGVNAGVGVMLPFKFTQKASEKRWAVSMEILYSQKGSRQKNNTGINFCDTCPPEIACDSTIKYRLYADYVSIPVLLHYTDKETWTFGLGFAYNRMVRAKEIENGVETATNLASKIYNPNELSVILDIRCRIWQQLKLNFRFEYSVLPIRTRTFHLRDGVPVDAYKRQQRNNVLTLRLVYMFNEKKVNVDKKNRVPKKEKIYYY